MPASARPFAISPAAHFRASPNLERHFQPASAAARATLRPPWKCSIANNRHHGKLPRHPSPPLLPAHANPASPSPSAANSTGKSRRQSTTRPDHEPNANAQLCSTIFRKNYAMLAAVFGAGFAFEMGFNSGMNKIWDNYNRGRQWKDIRSKYAAEVEEDDE
ncbi:Cytochrome b-c1 complex subunit 9 [Tolypocladium capitatum]|uniref:Complex III subunit 9 n=1 Tax=Tolypocladium capitatum TaxID=45235 RepID=A0A2K3QN82_9HYPO|nr:Cytochrome b-c1 complex subunit 9 [Tolypocladium capitatum]